MTTDHDIDELLRQDEAELKAKRRRLKSFATAVDEARRAQAAAARIADELIEAGDLSRADLGRVFKLTRTERAALVPARRASGADAPVQVADASADQASEADNGDRDAA
jgi:hypothetical protein